MRSRTGLGAIALGATLSVGAPAQSAAQTDQLFATGPTVNVRFFGSFAGFTNQLYWCSVVGNCPQLLFDASTSPLGSIATVNHTFALGEEAIFAIFVTNTSNWFYTGPITRNADGVGHFQVTPSGDPNFPFRGGFEDIFGGGDRDYNDIMFDFQSVAPTVVPEPASLALIGSGLLGLAGAVVQRRRRR